MFGAYPFLFGKSPVPSLPFPSPPHTHRGLTPTHVIHLRANPGMHYAFEMHNMQNHDRLQHCSANAYPFTVLFPCCLWAWLLALVGHMWAHFLLEVTELRRGWGFADQTSIGCAEWCSGGAVIGSTRRWLAAGSDNLVEWRWQAGDCEETMVGR
jgi:hypothetical protein